MKKQNFVKGMIAGLAVGGALGMLMRPKKKTAKSVVAGALRSVGDAIDNIGGMMGL